MTPASPSRRPFWTGAIRFGLLRIPVAMHPASRPSELGFELVDDRDYAPVGYRKVNKVTGDEVPADRIVRVYRTDGEEAVVVTEADLARARPRGLRTLDLEGFVKAADIPAPYYDTPYYLEPAGEDAHAYRLLRDLLRQSRTVGLGRAVLRTREHLGALLPYGDSLIFNTLRFIDEIRRPVVSEALDREPEPSPEERSMGERLLRRMELSWRPEDFHDHYREELLAYIRKKAETGEARKIFEPEPEEEPTAPTAGQIPELLRRSLSESDEQRRRSAS